MIDLSVKHLGYVADKHRVAFIDAILALEIEGRHVYLNRLKTLKCKNIGCAYSCKNRICDERRDMTIADQLGQP